MGLFDSWEQTPLAEEERSTDAMIDAEPLRSDVTQSNVSSDRFSSSYADRIRQTPSLESDRWAGERGESECAPRSDAARQIMEERGIAGVQYRDGVPDFSPFSESTVQLGYMTDARHSQGLSSGRDGKDSFYADIEDGEVASMSHHADKDSMADLHMKYDKPGNFEQADILTAEQWTADKRDGREWTAEDVAQYRQDHGLTWHECNDMETMQMIPEAINADFGHLGGVGEVKETQRAVEEALRGYDQEEMAEEVDYDSMTPEELDAVARDHGHYDDKGKWMPDDPSEEASEEADIDSSTVEARDDPLPDGQTDIDSAPDGTGDHSPDDALDNMNEDETPDNGDEESIIDTQEAEEPAAEEAIGQETEESFDSLADEEPETLLDGAADYNDLADEAVEELFDDSGCEGLADEAEESFADDVADYSDLDDDVDSGSFDSSDASFDSGDTGLFDGGGETVV